MSEVTAVERRQRGRPANIDKMTEEEQDAVLAAQDELGVAWAKYTHLRGRNISGSVNQPLKDALAAAAEALRTAREVGLTWRDCGKAMGVNHQSAYSWWGRHGSGAVDWKKKVESDG